MFSDFGNTPTSGREKGPISLEAIDTWLKDNVKACNPYALLFATLNGDQEEAGIGKVLRSHGFRKHASGYNLGHKTDVFAYIKTNKRPDLAPSPRTTATTAPLTPAQQREAGFATPAAWLRAFAETQQ